MIGLTLGQQSWLRLLNIDHHEVMPGTDASMAPGHESRRAEPDAARRRRARGGTPGDGVARARSGAARPRRGATVSAWRGRRRARLPRRPDRAQPADAPLRLRRRRRVPDLTNPVLPPIVRGIEETLWSAGLACLLADTDNDLEREAALIEELRSRRCEGLIVASAARTADLALSRRAPHRAGDPRDRRQELPGGRRRRGRHRPLSRTCAISATSGSRIAGPLTCRRRCGAFGGVRGTRPGRARRGVHDRAGERAARTPPRPSGDHRDRRRQRHDRAGLLRRVGGGRPELPDDVSVTGHDDMRSSTGSSRRSRRSRSRSTRSAWRGQDPALARLNGDSAAAHGCRPSSSYPLLAVRAQVDHRGDQQLGVRVDGDPSSPRGC